MEKGPLLAFEFILKVVAWLVLWFSKMAADWPSIEKYGFCPQNGHNYVIYQGFEGTKMILMCNVLEDCIF